MWQILSFDLIREAVSFNLFRGRHALYWDRLFCWLWILLSFGILEPWVYIRYLRKAHDLTHLHLGGFSFKFSAKISDYVKKVWVPNLIYNCLTFGLWWLLGFSRARAEAWVDSKVALSEHIDSSHITGNLAELQHIAGVDEREQQQANIAARLKFK
jgi:hypothetical protein